MERKCVEIVHSNVQLFKIKLDFDQRIITCYIHPLHLTLIIRTVITSYQLNYQFELRYKLEPKLPITTTIFNKS